VNSRTTGTLLPSWSLGGLHPYSQTDLRGLNYPATAFQVHPTSGAKQQEAIDILLGKGNMIVSPTKVGYIIMTSDVGGLKQTFSAKQRALNKPGVVLCVSMEQLCALAQINDEIDDFYQKAWDDDILIGCILPWKTNAMSHIPDDGSREMMVDSRGTSFPKTGAPAH
jgi:hypothetical protein